MPIYFEIVHICAYIQNTNAYEVLTASNILYLYAMFVPLHL